CAGRILLDVLHQTGRIILGEKDVFVTERRKSNGIKDHARAAGGKAGNPTVTILVNSNAITLVRSRTAGMMEPLDHAITVILGGEDIRAARSRVRDGQSIEGCR